MSQKYRHMGYKYAMPYSHNGPVSPSGQRHDFDYQYRKGRLAEEKSVRRKKEQVAKKMKTNPI